MSFLKHIDTLRISQKAIHIDIRGYTLKPAADGNEVI